MSLATFVASSTAFAKALAQVTPVVPNNPIAPILHNVLLICTGSVVGTAAKVQLVCSNFETTVSTTLSVEAQENFALCVPAKKLLATLRALPDGPLVCEVNAQEFTFSLSLGRSKYKLAGENPIDFFKPVSLERQHERIQVPANLLRSALLSALVTAATGDQRESLNCILIHAEQHELRMVGCDGHSLSVHHLELANEASKDEVVTWGEKAFKLLIPRQSAQILASQLDAKDETPVVLLADSRNIRSEGGRWISRLSDEIYVDYESVMPTVHTKTLYLAQEELSAALRRLKTYTPDKTDLLTLLIESDTLEIRADEPAIGDHGTEVISCLLEGEPMTIGFPAARLLEVLALWPGEKIQLCMTDPNRAIIISATAEEEEPALTCLVMPTPTLAAVAA